MDNVSGFSKYSDKPAARLEAIINRGVEDFLEAASEAMKSTEQANKCSRIQHEVRDRILDELSRMPKRPGLDWVGFTIDCFLGACLLIDRDNQKELGERIKEKKSKMLESEN